MRPVAVEHGFGIAGAAAPPVHVDLGNGRVIALRGLIDRIEQGENGRVVVTDYKTGSSSSIRTFGVMEATRHQLDPDAARALVEWRRRRGWSQRRAAREIGTSHGYVQFLERGERCPSVAMAEAIVKAYRVNGWEALHLLDAALPNVGRSWRTLSDPVRPHGGHLGTVDLMEAEHAVRSGYSVSGQTLVAPAHLSPQKEKP